MRRKMIFVPAITLLFSFIFAASAFAVVYYVNGATGKDQPDWGKTRMKPFLTIAYALARPDARKTVRIAAGTYNEQLSITEFQVIELQGSGVGKTFISGTSDKPVVDISGPTKASISRITIENGLNGILSRFSYVKCQNVRVRGQASHGVYAKSNSTLEFSESSAVSNGGYGVRIHSSSSGSVISSTFQKNTGGGINSAYASYVYAEKCIISESPSNGVQVHGDSVAYLLNNEIFSNTYSGVGLTESSSVTFGGGNKIHGNGDNSGWRAGVGVYHSSQAIFIPEVADNKDDIYENNGPGVFLSENCGMLMKSAIVRNNHGDGVTINMGSYGQFEIGAIIEGNDGYGINCTDVGNKSGQPGSLAGNGSGETTCQ